MSFDRHVEANRLVRLKIGIARRCRWVHLVLGTDLLPDGQLHICRFYCYKVQCVRKVAAHL
jgi:hypothetical protein